VTESSVKPSSASDTRALPGAAGLHLWLSRRFAVDDSRAFARQVLSRYVGLAPERLRFSRGEHGKPELVYPACPVAFNMSGSGGWLALAVSGGPAVGVDLEYCDPYRDVLKLARRGFNQSEVTDLQACSGHQRTARFYDYWTLKEARVKSSGGSLGRQLQATAFALAYPGAGTTGVGSIVALPEGETGSAWYGLLQPLPDYRLALCCRSGQDFAPNLRLFELGENGAANKLPFTFCATSPAGACSAGV